MKIKLTEGQYNRLLVENDKDFLDGMVNFKHIGNKVTPFIVKLFNIVDRKCKDCSWDSILRIIQNDFSLSKEEAILLTYNYSNFRLNRLNDEWSFEEVLGDPLIYYGKFSYKTEVPVYGNIDGYVSGSAEAYATSYEDFIDKMNDGESEMVVTSWSDVEPMSLSSVDWEIDHDYGYQRLETELDDYITGDMDDFINKVDIGL